MISGALARFERVLPALWAGALIAVAAIATPAPFATLARADAARVAARILEQEAWLSLVVGIVLLLAARRRAAAVAAAGRGSLFSGEMLIVLGTIACTVAGYFGVLPLLGAARSGQGALSFAQLHTFSVICYLVKCVLVLTIVWRTAGAAG